LYLDHAPISSLSKGGSDAVAMSIAQQYVEAFSKLAKTNNTMLLPTNMSDPASMVAQVSSSTYVEMGTH
jgi:hypothetical protein